VRLFESRFGDLEQVERFPAELRVRRRRKGESIQALHQDICRLLALSYPGETGTLSKIVGRDAFLESLADPELRIRILEKGADSIEKAFAIAARYESFMAGNEALGADEGSRRKVRAVNPPTENNVALGARLDKMEAAFTEFAGAFKQWQSQLQTQPQCAEPSLVAKLPSASTTSAWSRSAGGRRGGAVFTGRSADVRRGCFTCGQFGHIKAIVQRTTGGIAPPYTAARRNRRQHRRQSVVFSGRQLKSLPRGHRRRRFSCHFRFAREVNLLLLTRFSILVQSTAFLKLCMSVIMCSPPL
jgi:hypothetical protein